MWEEQFKNSVILFGIDWNKVSQILAEDDIRENEPEVADTVDRLDKHFRIDL